MMMDVCVGRCMGDGRWARHLLQLQPTDPDHERSLVHERSVGIYQ